MGKCHLRVCRSSLVLLSALLVHLTAALASSPAYAAELQPFLSAPIPTTPIAEPRANAPRITRPRARRRQRVESSTEARDLSAVETRSTPRLRDRLIELALHLVDKPYQTGQSGPSPRRKDGHLAFDCSGYVYYVLKTVLQGGFKLPRMSAVDYRTALAHRGGGRRCSETAPGDLVFFDRGHENYHIGIMTEASSGTFISATGSRRGVDYSSIYDLYWRKYHAECYRNVWLDDDDARQE